MGGRLPRLVTAILARNEADRYLRRVIEHHLRLGPVLVLDDHSDDTTPLVAQEAGAVVRARATNGGPMWGQESHARRELWDWATQEAGRGWVLICDADQLLMGNPLPLTTSWLVNTWTMPLYDCWDSEEIYRADGFWQGYKTPRPWLFRPSLVPEGWEAMWPERGVHCGHCPCNWPAVAGVCPQDIFWLHLGYVTKEARQAKYDRYKEIADQLTPWERAHAVSILDEAE